jgi:hypothetical protein
VIGPATPADAATSITLQTTIGSNDSLGLFGSGPSLAAARSQTLHLDLGNFIYVIDGNDTGGAPTTTIQSALFQ